MVNRVYSYLFIFISRSSCGWGGEWGTWIREFGKGPLAE